MFDAVLCDVVAPPPDLFIEVHVHQFEDERKAARRLIKQDLEKLDDVRMRRQPA
jgi:hypothetical protein